MSVMQDSDIPQVDLTTALVLCYLVLMTVTVMVIVCVVSVNATQLKDGEVCLSWCDYLICKVKIVCATRPLLVLMIVIQPVVTDSAVMKDL